MATCTKVINLRTFYNYYYSPTYLFHIKIYSHIILTSSNWPGENDPETLDPDGLGVGNIFVIE